MAHQASITSGMTKQLGRVAQDGVDRGIKLIFKKMEPDDEALDRLLKRGGELQDAIVDAMLQATRKIAFSTASQ